MILKWVASLYGAVISAQVFAFPCYFTLAKDSCWTNYDVKVVVIDAESNKPLITVEIPKRKSWIRQPFTCQPGQKLIYHATFQPSFWQTEEGKTYTALHYWLLPATVSNNDTAWDISVCYPEAFAQVPFPPTANGNCQCDFNSIPPIKPRKS